MKISVQKITTLEDAHLAIESTMLRRLHRQV